MQTTPHPHVPRTASASSLRAFVLVRSSLRELKMRLRAFSASSSARSSPSPWFALSNFAYPWPTPGRFAACGHIQAPAHNIAIGLNADELSYLFHFCQQAVDNLAILLLANKRAPPQGHELGAEVRHTHRHTHTHTHTWNEPDKHVVRSYLQSPHAAPLSVLLDALLVLESHQRVPQLPREQHQRVALL